MIEIALKMKLKFIFLSTLLFMSFLGAFGQSKTYVKNYFENGKIESEGWVQDDMKVDYWFFYYENGKKKEEGHYAKNNKTKWWIWYNNQEIILKKCQFYNDKLNGLALIYQNGNLFRAEKYKMNIKTNQWNSVAAYKKDHILSFI